MWRFARDVLDWISDNSFVLLLDLILTGLLAYPLYRYVVYGWLLKWEEMDTSLDPFAKKTYLSLFHSTEVTLSEADRAFSDFYRVRYGWSHLILPIWLLIIVAAIGNFLVASDLIRLASSGGKLRIEPAAVAGAYTFVTFDLFARLQRRNMSVADIMRSALRLAISIPMGFAFAALLQPDVGAFIAFAVGVFPLGDLLTLLRQIANKRLDLEIGPSPIGSQVGKLLGVDPPTALRIEDADITTIQQLSACDPVQLAMRTNLQFRFVANTCSQALAWVYLETKLGAVRPLGLGTAFEIRDLVVFGLYSPDAAAVQRAEAVLAVAATAADVPVDGLRHTFEQIASSPNSKFLYDALLGRPTGTGAG